MIEISIKIKDGDTTLTEKFLEYDPIFLSQADPKLEQLVELTKAKFKGELIDPDIMIKIKMPW